MLQKKNIKEIILDLILLLPITTLFQRMISSINRICLIGIIILLLISLLKYKYKRIDFSILITAIIGYLYAIFITAQKAYNFNDYIYFPFFIIYTIFILYDYNYFQQYCEEKAKYILRIIQIWSIVVFISIFMPSSYENGAFYSLTGDVFRSATSALFILSLITIIVRYQRKYIIYTILPLYTIFSGGSRTYLALGIIIFLIIYYMIVPSKKIFKLSLIPILFILFIIIINSSIMDKINMTTTLSDTDYYQDILVKFTSSRSLFWEADLKAYLNSNLIGKLFGLGFNFVYDINYIAVNSKIYAHNDYINILLNFGALGLIIYIYLYIKMIKKILNNKNLSAFMIGILIFIWFFNAFFNMFYTYTCAIASYPFLLLGINKCWKFQRTKI